MPQFLLAQHPWQKQNNYRLSEHPFLFCFLNIYITCVAPMIFSLDLCVMDFHRSNGVTYSVLNSRSFPFYIPTFYTRCTKKDDKL